MSEKNLSELDLGVGYLSEHGAASAVRTEAWN